MSRRETCPPGRSGGGGGLNPVEPRLPSFVVTPGETATGVNQGFLADIAHVLETDPTISVKVVGPLEQPDMLLVNMPADRAARLKQAFGDRLQIVEDTGIDPVQ
jgi:hypothetical protein